MSSSRGVWTLPMSWTLAAIRIFATSSRDSPISRAILSACRSDPPRVAKRVRVLCLEHRSEALEDLATALAG